MTKLERVEEITGALKRFTRHMHPGGCRIPSLGDECDCNLCLADELCDIARTALEERDGSEQLAQERARNVTQLQDLRHELSEKCVRLQRRLDAATELATFLSQEDCEYRTPLGNRWVSCGNCIPCRARLWLEDKQDG